jgi:hypothetical protein
MAGYIWLNAFLTSALDGTTAALLPGKELQLAIG